MTTFIDRIWRSPPAERTLPANTSPSRSQTHPPARDIRIDSLRGLMLVEITLVHTGCPLGRLSNEMFGRVSAAAGFVFLSGLVAGAVYSRTAERGPQALARRCLRRCCYIQAYHVGTFALLLGMLLLEPRLSEHFRFALASSGADAARALGYFAVWAYQPVYFDILPMYALFVLAMPAALLALRSGRGSAMLLVSLAVWGCAQAGLGWRGPIGDPFGLFRGDFNPIAWQFVFFSGLYFGYAHLHQKRRIVMAQPLLVALCVLICLVGLTMRWESAAWPESFIHGAWFTAKRDYGAAYLVNFLAFSYLVYCLAVRSPRAFSWPPLAFLGRHSLQVFSFHIFIVYLAGPLRWRAAAHGSIAYDAFGAVVVATLFIPAGWHARWRAWRDHRRRLDGTGATA